MLEEWTSAAKPKLDQALVAEHIEKMVEVRLLGPQAWGQQSAGGSGGQVSKDQFCQSPAAREPTLVPILGLAHSPQEAQGVAS